MDRNSISDVMDNIARLGFAPSTIIDVRIAYGTPGLYGKFPDAEHLLVEPLVEYEDLCQSITQKYGGSYIIAAAGDSPGETTLNVHPDMSGSSMFHESEGSHIDGTPRTVPVVTLDNLCRERNLKGPYILKVDTQGADILVLDGAKNVLKDTELVFLEAFIFQFYKGIPVFNDIVAYMHRNGFVVYDIFGKTNRLLDDALAQVDLAFVKQYGRFRKTNHFATPEQRKEFLASRLQHLNPKSSNA